MPDASDQKFTIEYITSDGTTEFKFEHRSLAAVHTALDKAATSWPQHSFLKISLEKATRQLSEPAQRLYDALRSQGEIWQGTEQELTVLVPGLPSPPSGHLLIDRHIFAELIDAGLIVLSQEGGKGIQTIHVLDSQQ